MPKWSNQRCSQGRGAYTPHPVGPALVAAREAREPWRRLQANYGLGRTGLLHGIYRGALDGRRGRLARGVDHLRRSIEGLEKGLGEIEAEIARLDALILDPENEE